MKIKLLYWLYITFFFLDAIIKSNVKKHDDYNHIFFATNITSDLLVSIEIRIKI